MKKRIFMVFIMCIIVTSLTACGQKQVETVSDVNLKQMKSICELATLECYYHNTAKYTDQKAVMWWNTNKDLWVEYDGIVTMGVDISKLNMDISDNVVIISMPDATILSCKVDESSLSEDSYVSKSSGLFADSVSAKDQTAAFADAQAKMLSKAESDYSLKLQAQQRAQELLEKYVKNIGNVLGKTYEVKWVKI